MAKKKVQETPKNDELSEIESFAAIDFGVSIPREQVEELEKHAQAYGVSRRIALAIVSISKADMLANRTDSMSIAETAELYMEQVEGMGGFIKHLNSQIEVANAARLRLMCMAATYQQQLETGAQS